METFLNMLVFQISIVELLIFQLGAIILGFAIHFFWASKKSLTIEKKPAYESFINEADEWRLKYYEQIDLEEKTQENYKLEIQELHESNVMIREELRQLRMEKERMMEKPEEPHHNLHAIDYLQELKTAQENLLMHNQDIGRLLEQIDILKESERKYVDIVSANETLNAELRAARKTLLEKEGEIKQIKRQQVLSKEVQERLDKAYAEFNLVQEKIQKVESHLVQPHNRSFEFEELQQSYFKLTKEFDELKLKYLAFLEENQRLTRVMADTEDKLREANFQRQHLIKKVSFLEELNKDLQQVSEHNKKLESQLRRIGEIETLLARLSSQREDEQKTEEDNTLNP